MSDTKINTDNSWGLWAIGLFMLAALFAGEPDIREAIVVKLMGPPLICTGCGRAYYQGFRDHAKQRFATEVQCEKCTTPEPNEVPDE